MVSKEKQTKQLESPSRWVAIVRVRGRVNVRYDVENTLKLLKLHRPNHCVVKKLTPSIKGMLIKAQHKIAWGELDFDTFLLLLKERGEIVGGKKLTDELVREKSNGEYKTIEELARAIWEGKTFFRQLSWLKPVFRLHPPKKGGFKRSVRKLYQEGGVLGYWGRDIRSLLERMI